MRSITRWYFVLLFLLTIPLAAQTNTPYAGAITIPGTLQVENYDFGGEGVAWHDTSAGNAFGVYRSHDMDVGAITGGGYHVGALETGEWAEYTVNVATTGSYTVTVRWASAYAGATTFRLRLNGVDVSGPQSVTSTGDWQTFTTKTFNANLTAGSNQILRIDFETGFWNPDSLQFSSCTAPTVTSPVNKTVDPGTTVSWTVSTTGSPALQWFKNGVAIPGATSARLDITNAEQGKDGGQYSVRATNACGTVTSTAAMLRVRCGQPTKPEDIEEDISRALRGQSEYCEWSAHVAPSFGTTWDARGSYNIPVVAAAVAFIREPFRSGTSGWDMNSWWTNYLQGELGDRGTAWYYGGRELHSYNYQSYNTSAVLAVHYWANKTGNTPIRDLARRWLRATFALQALSAMPQKPLSLHAKGQTNIPSVNYTGPWIVTAGERSSWNHWMEPNRNVYLASAIGLPTNELGEWRAQKNVRTFVDDWLGIYPFTSAEKSELAAAVNYSTPIPNLVSNYLGPNLRTNVRYHIVAWGGVKATLMESNVNNLTSPTFGVAYFTAPKFASGREAHFLWPWQGLWVDGSTAFKNGICNGTALLDMPLRYLQATHPDCANHPAETVSIDGLPAEPWKYWVTLSQWPTTVQ